jgi:hypothetical protein
VDLHFRAPEYQRARALVKSGGRRAQRGAPEEVERAAAEPPVDEAPDADGRSEERRRRSSAPPPVDVKPPEAAFTPLKPW